MGLVSPESTRTHKTWKISSHRRAKSFALYLFMYIACLYEKMLPNPLFEFDSGCV